MGTSELDQGHNSGLETVPGIDIDQVIPNSNQLKCSDNLRSAVRTAFSGNLRFVSLMILSVIPLFGFMIFYEIKLQKLMHSLPDVLNFSPRVVFMSYVSSGHSSKFSQHIHVDREDSLSFTDLIKLCAFYLILYPVVEFFNIYVTIKCTSKKHSGEAHFGIKQTLRQSNFQGMFVTYVCVHLLSALTLLGMFWEVVILAKHFVSSSNGFWNPYEFDLTEFCANVLYVGFHSAVFIFLLYKFLSWSAYWNLSIVVSVLEEETGIDAFGLADYYGKHYMQTGFQLMLVFFTFCNVLRLPAAAVVFGLNSSGFAGIWVTAVVMGLFCLGNLVKWVAFVLFFYECKQKVMEKKGDEVVGKSTADAC